MTTSSATSPCIEPPAPFPPLMLSDITTSTATLLVLLATAGCNSDGEASSPVSTAGARTGGAAGADGAVGSAGSGGSSGGQLGAGGAPQAGSAGSSFAGDAGAGGQGGTGQGGSASACVPSPTMPTTAVPLKNSNVALVAIHDDYKSKCASPHPVIFVGDSLTWGWDFGDAAGKASFDSDLAVPPYSAATFGIGGDSTQHLLWRLQDGEIDGCAGTAKAAVLLIGINNIFGGATPTDTVAGIQASLSELRCRLPNTKVLLLGLWPAKNVQAATLQQVNASLMALADGDKVRYLDLGPALAPSGSTASNPNYGDGVHLTAAGYAIYAAQVKPALDAMLQ